MFNSFQIRTALLFQFLLILNLGAQEYISTFYTTQQGLPQEYIYAVDQDTNGYLWVGTGGGVSRFDGFGFKNYTITDSLADDFVTAVLSDKENMYLGHMNGDISLFSNGIFRKIIPDIEDKSAITGISYGVDGQVWASTFSSGLILLSNKTQLPVYKIKGERLPIVSFKFLTGQDLLIGSSRGLYHGRLTTTNEIEIIYHYKEIPDDKVQNIIDKHGEKGFYIATQNEGIFHFSNKEVNPHITSIDTQIEPWVGNIQTIFEDSRQNLWIGTFGYGLFKTKPDAKGNLHLINSFESGPVSKIQNIKTIYEDNEENIWLGNYGGGLVRLKHKVYFFDEFEESIYGSNVQAVCIDDNYRWVGTNKGLIKIGRNDGNILDFYNNERLSIGKITALYTDNNQVLYIGTEWDGLVVMGVESGKIKKLEYATGNLEKSITSIVGERNKLWFGTQKGVCEFDKRTFKKKWYTIQTIGLPHNSISQLYFDSFKRLWITTPTSTLCYLQEGKLEKINLSNESGGAIFQSVTQDSAQTIWAGTQGNGVFAIFADSVMNIKASEGLFSDYCYSLTSDKNGNIWIGHRKGLSRLNTNSLAVQAISGINSQEFNFDFNPNASFTDSKGVLWIGHSKGLMQYHPELENVKKYPPKLDITALRVNDADHEILNRLILKPGKYKIQIEYIGVSLKAPEQVKYQYMLQGYDDDWSQITSKNSVTYQRLSEGRYKFILNAESGDGITTIKPTEISIIIKAPVWKQAWFYVVLMVIVVLLVYGYIKRREYKLNEEKGILEQRVQERTLEIQRQKNEIQEQRDLIELKNTDITDSIKYARTIQSAIVPPVALLDNMLPEHFIINKPRDIVSGDFIWFAEKKEKIVITVTDCTGHGVPGAIMSMLGVSALNEIVNGRNITRANLILDALREKVVDTFSQKQSDSITFDGMSLSLVVINMRSHTFEFAGAYNNLLYYSNCEQKILYADRIPVGASYVEDVKFKSQKLEYKPGDVIYLYSDGYQDQFGGDNDKKFSSRRLRQTLFTVHQLPMPDQKQILVETLDEWKGDREQTDDITILGIRL